MKKAKASKTFWEMTPQERTAAVAEFDAPLPPGRLKPLSAAQRARFERARGAGGKGIRQILALDLDPALLDEAAAYARRKNLTIDQLLERGLRRELAVQD